MVEIDTLKRYVGTALLLWSLSYLSSGAAATAHSEAQVTGDYPAINLFNSTTDVLGHTLQYPDCPAKVHSVLITMAPGQVGKTHQHLTPLYAYIVSGQVSVTYEQGQGITRTYSEGEAIMEAMNVMHHGFNPGDTPATLLAVYLNCAD
ncbi:cupin domain-containing protein [Congregibacter sp.]|uniref:cupin domain-containing protein n=1 Tax=Congregibacter sp. TaxID=2744308 RepID=UPI003F6CBFC6